MKLATNVKCKFKNKNHKGSLAMAYHPPTATSSPFSCTQENCSLWKESATNIALPSLPQDTAKQPTFDSTSQCLHSNSSGVGMQTCFSEQQQNNWPEVPVTALLLLWGRSKSINSSSESFSLPLAFSCSFSLRSRATIGPRNASFET